MSRLGLNQNLRFRITIDGYTAAELGKMGTVGAKSVTLQTGRTQNTTFHDWAKRSSSSTRLPLAPSTSPRKNIRIEVFNETGQKTLTLNLQNSWVTNYQTMPELNAGANTVSIQTITIEYESFTRDPPN